jgi:FAD dependent oxidoreductase
MKILIIGSGLFGCSTAFVLSQSNYDVDLIDEQSDIMMKASFVNHNRIHLGYHYLRSIETAEQSIEGLLSFLFYYGDSVIYQFPNYYGIASSGSKSTPQQFLDFCNNVGIGYEEEYPSSKMVNRDLVEACYKVPEPIWDYPSLKNTIGKNLDKNKVNIFLNTRCEDIKILNSNLFEVTLSKGIQHYDVVINATYANLNKINGMLGIQSKRLLYEDVVIPVFNYPHDPIGLTIMDGPFCSVMPHGRMEKEFLLYNVKESVLRSKNDINKPDFDESENDFDKRKIYDASIEYMPFLRHVIHNTYNRTIRTVFENSDDARLSEVSTYEGVKNYFSILSGKVTTCMQVALEIKHAIQGKKNVKRFKI